MKTENISFTAPSGINLSGVWTEPDNAHAVVVLCHGFGTSKNNDTNTQLANIFAERNIACLRFDFIGHGESGGKFEDITISEASSEILSALDFAEAKGFKKIGLIGSSFGGISSIMAASETKKLSALGLKCPVSDYREKELHARTDEEIKAWEKQGFAMIPTGGGERRLNYSFVRDFANNDAYAAAEQIEVPTLIVHGKADEIVPAQQSLKTVMLMPHARLELIEGADHRFSDPEHFSRMIGMLSEFMTGELKR